MSVPWQAILEIIIKITLWIMGKNETKIEAKKKFYEFVAHLDSEIPIRLNQGHKAQMERVKRELEAIKRKEANKEETLKTYKMAYEELVAQGDGKTERDSDFIR